MVSRKDLDIILYTHIILYLLPVSVIYRYIRLPQTSIIIRHPYRICCRDGLLQDSFSLCVSPFAISRFARQNWVRKTSASGAPSSSALSLISVRSFSILGRDRQHPLRKNEILSEDVFFWAADKRRIKKASTEVNALLSCGERIRTNDLWVMSPTSYHCSTPRCLRLQR